MSATRRVVFSCLLAFAALPPGHASARDLKIATEGTYAPWSYVDNAGKLTGWDVDIANALCDEMKVKCENVAQEWDGIIPGLNAKKYDMIVASMGVTEKRKQQVAFTKNIRPRPANSWPKRAVLPIRRRTHWQASVSACSVEAFRTSS